MFLICGAGLLFVAIATLLWWPLPRPTPNIRVSFLYLTNDSVGNGVAVLSITNERNSNLSYTICDTQVKSNSRWPAIEVPHVAGRSLAGHSVATFNVAPPPLARGGVWREPVVWGYYPTGLELYRGMMRYNWYLLRHGKMPEWKSTALFDLYASYSPEIVAP